MGAAQKKTVAVLPLSSLTLDDRAQMRVALDSTRIREYADLYADGVVLEPVVVFFDGTTYWMADGFHRAHGAIKAKVESIAVDVRSGGLRDAEWFAIGANTKHGLARSNADKRKAVTVALKDEEWGKKSDRAIAAQAGVSQPFVGKLRSELITVISSVADECRIGKDGKTRRIPERKPKPPLEPANDIPETEEPPGSSKQAIAEPAPSNEPSLIDWGTQASSEELAPTEETDEPDLRPVWDVESEWDPEEAVLDLMNIVWKVIDGWPDGASKKPLVEYLRQTAAKVEALDNG